MGCGAAGAGGPGRKRPGGCLRCKNPAGYAGQAVMVGHICGRSPGSGGMSARVDRASATLARDGYCVIERAADPALIAGINEGLAPCFAATPLCEGNFYGPRTKRFGALLRPSPAMSQLVMPQQVLALVEAALRPRCDRDTQDVGRGEREV